MESNKVLKVIIIILFLIVIAGILFTIKKSSFFNPELPQNVISSEALIAKQSEAAALFQLPENPTLRAPSCKNLKHSAGEYYTVWKELLKQHNNLSEGEYNQLIRITSVGFSESISGEGTSIENRGCDLLISGTIKVDWLFVGYSQSIKLSIYNRLPFAPEFLSTSSEVVNDNVSIISILKKKLAFTNIDSITNFYTNKYKKVWNSNPRIDEGIEMINAEPSMRVWGRIPRGEKACVTGTIGLITRQTTYFEEHCNDPISPRDFPAVDLSF